VKRSRLIPMLVFVLATFFTNPIMSGETETVQAELISEQQSIESQAPFWIGIHLTMDNDWHTYWKNPGEAGAPLLVEWELPEGYEISALYWPTPKRYDISSIIGYGYEKEVTFLAKVTPPKETHDQSATIKAHVQWLACSADTCLPGQATLSKTLPLKQAKPELDEAGARIITAARTALPKVNCCDVTATRTADKLEVKVKVPKHDNQTLSAYFCPAEPELIDDKSAAQAVASVGKTGEYTVALKDSSGGSPKADTLRGVLVFHDEANSDRVVQSIEVDVPISTSSVAPPLFEGGLGFYILTAFLGGLILNLMPCVLPVMSFKILGFVKMAGQSRKETFKHGFAFSIGVLLSFWVLAGMLLTLQAYGHLVGWGFQLQEPLFVGILAIVILIFSMSLFGVFEIGTFFASLAGKQQSKGIQGESQENLSTSFFSGILATAVATPCTGPFLGSAVGFAVTQPPIWALLIFTSLGAGMASPYLILAAFPSLLRFLPKPGQWMVTFKEATGFIMLATVLWLMWVFGAQTDSFALFLMLTSLFTFAFGCWIYGKWASPIKKKPVRMLGTAVTVACFILGGNLAYQAVSPEVVTIDQTQPMSTGDHHPTGAWVPFHPDSVQAHLNQGRPVLVDFTAKWCLICQSNHLVLSSDELDKRFNALNVVKMKGDWTKHDAIITEELRKHGRNGVPLYLLYSGDPNEPPIVLPQLLTADTIHRELDKIENKQIALKDK